MNQPQLKFNFAAGKGVLRSKMGTDRTCIISGRVALPVYGQCFVDGLAPAGAKKLVLDVRRVMPDGKRVAVGTLTLPSGSMAARRGKLSPIGEKPVKSWTVVATIRTVTADGSADTRMVLDLPDVKSTGGGSNAFGVPS